MARAKLLRVEKGAVPLDDFTAIARMMDDLTNFAAGIN
jgi:hypothetical protein